MTTYTVTVINKSSEDVLFLLFVDNRSLPGYHTNVYCRTKTVGRDNGRFDIRISPNIFGVCGLASGPLDAGISVRDAQSRALQSSPGRPSAATCGAAGDGLTFTEDVTVMSQLKDGQIGLKLKSFPADKLKHAFVGYGKAVPGDLDIISPVLTTKARPTAMVLFKPQPVFFVAAIPASDNAGADGYARGTIETSASFGEVASVDFVDQPPGKDIAEVTLLDDGFFTVKYTYVRRL